MVLVLLFLIVDFALNLILKFSHMLIDAKFDLLVDQFLYAFPHILRDILLQHLILRHLLLLRSDLWWRHFSTGHSGVRGC